MFIEAEDVADPTQAPVLLWSNGGPGASSAYGLFTELGPLMLNAESLRTDPPTLFRNPYAWTRLANVLILNGPAPVGFSYCDPAGPGGNRESCGSWNDTRTNAFNTIFVERFFELFPECVPQCSCNTVPSFYRHTLRRFKRSPFFVTGESYAGVCVCGGPGVDE